MRRFPRILSARAQTNLAGGIACCVRCSFFSFSILFLPLSFFVCIPAGPWQLHLIHVISICPWDGSDKYCRCSLAPPSRLPSLASSSPLLFRGLPSERNCSGKRQRNEGVMRTQSGRCSYCFKADRFIYCPNNVVESSWPFAPPFAVLNCALLTLMPAPHVFLPHDIVTMILRQSWFISLDVGSISIWQ